MTRIELGSTYTLRVAPGHVIACRALAKREGYTLLVAVEWHGAPGTSLEAMKRSKRLYRLKWLTHHNWKNHNPPMLLADWVRDTAPLKGFRFVGVAAVTTEELADLARTNLAGGISLHLGLQTRLQWRWDHERAKVLAEDRKAKQAEDKKFAAAERALEKARAKLRKAGPRALLRRVWFSDFRPSKKREACRVLMRELVRDLVGEADGVRRIAACVEAFNALEPKYGFDTPDAEQIMEGLQEVADACGVSDAAFGRQVDARRDF